MTGSLPDLAERPLPGPMDSLPRRRTALDELRAAGWPQKRRERWRYTDLEPLASAGFDVATAGDTGFEPAPGLLSSLTGDAPRLVFVDGRLNRTLSTSMPAGLEALDLDTEWSEFDRRWAGDVATADYPLAALNTAFNEQGLWLRVAPLSTQARPLHLVQLSSGRPGVAAQPRVVVEIGERARITLEIGRAHV